MPASSLFVDSYQPAGNSGQWVVRNGNINGQACRLVLQQSKSEEVRTRSRSRKQKQTKQKVIKLKTQCSNSNSELLTSRRTGYLLGLLLGANHLHSLLSLFLSPVTTTTTSHLTMTCSGGLNWGGVLLIANCQPIAIWFCSFEKSSNGVLFHHNFLVVMSVFLFCNCGVVS